MLAEFGLWERRTEPVKNYSKGMKQRLVLLGASLESAILLFAAVVSSALFFAVLGTLFSVPPTDNAALAMIVFFLIVFGLQAFLSINATLQKGFEHKQTKICLEKTHQMIHHET